LFAIDPPPSGAGRVVSLSPTPSGKGCWIFTDRGAVFAYGDAPHLGDLSGQRLNAPVLDSIATPSGQGYYMVAADGGIFAFNADFRGSMGGTRLNKPVTGMIAYGNGYLMVAQDGGIFNFSDRSFSGNLGSTPPPRPVVAVAALPG
jgi:ribosomal protein L24E